jgi:hypothetical protein
VVAKGMERYCSTVLRAFKARGLATDQDVIAAGGPSTSTMTKLRERTLAETGPRGDVHRKVDAAAGWVAGSSRALWEEGALPRVVGAEVPPALTDEDMDPRGSAAIGIGARPVDLPMPSTAEIETAALLSGMRDLVAAVKELTATNRALVAAISSAGTPGAVAAPGAAEGSEDTGEAILADMSKREREAAERLRRHAPAPARGPEASSERPTRDVRSS